MKFCFIKGWSRWTRKAWADWYWWNWHIVFAAAGDVAVDVPSRPAHPLEVEYVWTCSRLKSNGRSINWRKNWIYLAIAKKEIVQSCRYVKQKWGKFNKTIITYKNFPVTVMKFTIYLFIVFLFKFTSITQFEKFDRLTLVITL